MEIQTIDEILKEYISKIPGPKVTDVTIKFITREVTEITGVDMTRKEVKRRLIKYLISYLRIGFRSQTSRDNMPAYVLQYAGIFLGSPATETTLHP